MRTTITLADDVAAAVERLRRERSGGLSDIVNDLLRAGLVAQRSSYTFRQQTHDLGRRTGRVEHRRVARDDGPAAA
jgi:hypothetical protein